MAIERVKGHSLQVGPDHTQGEPNFGTCQCGWNTRQRTRQQVRNAYRQHLTMLNQPKSGEQEVPGSIPDTDRL